MRGSSLLSHVARYFATIVLIGIAVIFVDTGVSAQVPEKQPQTLGKEKLEQLVAPIALHPDSLLSQILMASTYPLEVVQAERWVKANPKVTGKALEDALQTQPWDPSVKSLTAVPAVLQMMNDKLDWTQQLGDAFLAQQEDVLAAVQALRERADRSGNLKTTKQQKVAKTSAASTGSGGSQLYSTPQSYYVIESQDPSRLYVPAYDPAYIYGSWPYPSYPPYYWYPPGYVASRALWFGAGAAVGWALWGNCNWGRGNVHIDVNRFNNFNRTDISSGNWQHNVAHRKGVPYANQRVANQFRGQAQGRVASREQFRGRAEAGQRDLASQAGRQHAAAKGPAQLPSKGAGQAKGDRARAAHRPAQKAAQRPASKATAFDRGGSGKSVRQASARGQASRQAASFSRGGGGRSLSGGGGGRSFGGGRGGGGRGGGRRSDIRVKHDVVLLGHLDNGLGYYRFAYNGSRKQYVGVMAQETTKVMPQAVTRDGQGYLRVRYEALGIKFQTYDAWIASGAVVPKAIGQ